MISDRENVKQEGSPGIRVRDSRDRPLNFPSNLDVHDRRDAGAMGVWVCSPDQGQRTTVHVAESRYNALHRPGSPGIFT